jgi:AraC-like DNA-binding protein
MKATFESLSTLDSQSFLVRKFEGKTFTSPYHFHPEYELTLILEGSGKRYVGSHMNDYFPDDLVLLGANLPHCWKTEHADPGINSRSVVVQFQKGFLGIDFFDKSKLQQIAQLLDNSNYGLQFTEDTEYLREKIIALADESNGFKRLLLMLEILYELATTNDYVLLDNQSAYADLSLAERERIHSAMAYIVNNFQSKILLKDAAAAANMSPTSFCKYFKKISRKTFIEVVTDYRIDYATRQLVHTDMPVAQIGFDSGFNDISNFYKTFKTRMKLSPSNYRNAFIEKIH